MCRSLCESDLKSTNRKASRSDSTRAKMEKSQSSDERVSPAQAVLLGALSPGVNGPTWTTLQSAFLMLGVSLAVMLGLAFSSSDSWMVLHVMLLVVLAGSLFILLSWFLAQTGLVSVEHQMKEMGLTPANNEEQTIKES